MIDKPDHSNTVPRMIVIDVSPVILSLLSQQLDHHNKSFIPYPMFDNNSFGNKPKEKKSHYLVYATLNESEKFLKISVEILILIRSIHSLTKKIFAT